MGLRLSVTIGPRLERWISLAMEWLSQWLVTSSWLMRRGPYADLE